MTGIAFGFGSGEAPDDAPETFSFAPLADRPANRASESGSVTISGLGDGVSASVETEGEADPQVRIDGGSLASSGVIQNGQTLSISLFPTAWGATVTGYVTVGSGAQVPFQVTTAPAPVVTLAASPLPDADVGQSYGDGSGFDFKTLVSFTGGSVSEPPLAVDVTWSLSGLPDGMSFDASTGVLSGAPATEGEATLTVTATLEAGIADSEIYTLYIFDDTLDIEGGEGS
jgi:hypothetical protein